MRKLHYFFILNSWVGQANAAPFREILLTGYLQSCGHDRGCPDVTATPDTLLCWPGCKTNGVLVLFTNVYCWLLFACEKAQVISPRVGEGELQSLKNGGVIVPCTRLPRLQFELTNRHSAGEKNFTVVIECKFTRKAWKSGNFSHWKLYQILKKRNLQFQNNVRL